MAWVSKYGTKIDLTGLNSKQAKEIQALANSKYGTKATQLAKKYRKPQVAPPLTSGPATPAAAPNTALEQSLGGLAAAGTTPSERTINAQTFAPERQRIEQQQYQALTSDFARREAQQKQQLEQDLYNRGYRPDQTSTTGPGSWDSMQGEFRSNWNDAYMQAKAQAQQLGGQEFDRMFGAQEDMINSQQNREQYLGSLAQAGLDRAAQERMAEAQRKNAVQIANIQMRRSGVSGARAPSRPAREDPGFDIIQVRKWQTIIQIRH